MKKPASAPSGAGGIDLKDASGEVFDLKASWPDIPEFGSADSLSASIDTALLPQKAQAAGDELPICGEGSTICAATTVCQKPCISAEIGQPGWAMTCMDGGCGGTSKPSLLSRFWKWIKNLFGTDEERAQRKINIWKESSKDLPTAYMVCNGKGGFRPELNKYKGAPCGVEECIKNHEAEHIKNFKQSDKYKNWCVMSDGKNKPNGTIVEISDPSYFDITECNASTVGSNCLEAKLSKAATSACKAFLSEEFQQSKLRQLKYCTW